MKKYEAMIIFRESLKDTEWDAAVEAVRSEIERQGGTMSSCTRLGKREFAREMNKQSSGHYALIAMELEGDKVAPLQARLKLNHDVFRVQVVVAPPAPETAAAAAAGSAGEEGDDDGIAE